MHAPLWRNIVPGRRLYSWYQAYLYLYCARTLSDVTVLKSFARPKAARSSFLNKKERSWSWQRLW